MMLLNVMSSLLISLTLLTGEGTEKTMISSSSDTGWKMVEQDETLTIFERWISLPDGRTTRERKGVFYTDKPSDDIVPLLSNASGIKGWMHGVEDSRELYAHRVNDKMVYILFDVPWPFKNRDMIAEIRTYNNCDNGCAEVFFTAKRNILPEYSNIVRMHSYEAHWKITPVPNGTTKVSFSAYSETNPVAPRWIQDPVMAKLFRDNLLNLYELLTFDTEKDSLETPGK